MFLALFLTLFLELLLALVLVLFLVALLELFVVPFLVVFLAAFATTGQNKKIYLDMEFTTGGVPGGVRETMRMQMLKAMPPNEKTAKTRCGIF